MSPRLRPLRIVALVTSLALAALFVAYRVSSASKGTEPAPATPPAASPTAGASPAAVPDAAKPAEDATEEPAYFAGSKSGVIRFGREKPAGRIPSAPTPPPPPQAPAK